MKRQVIFYGWQLELEQRNAINLEWFKRRWKAHKTGWAQWLGGDYYDRPTYIRRHYGRVVASTASDRKATV